MDTGYPRIHYGTNSNDYVAKEFASMGVRHGLYDWLTLEGHGEEVAGLYNAGAGVLARTGNFGILSVAASSSRYQGQPGFQAYLSCETKIWGVSLSASSTRTFMSYNDVASATAPVIDALSAPIFRSLVHGGARRRIERGDQSGATQDDASLGADQLGSLSGFRPSPAVGRLGGRQYGRWHRVRLAQTLTVYGRVPGRNTPSPGTCGLRRDDDQLLRGRSGREPSRRKNRRARRGTVLCFPWLRTASACRAPLDKE